MLAHQGGGDGANSRTAKSVPNLPVVFHGVKHYALSGVKQTLILFPGLIYTCVATLAVTGHLHYVDPDLLGWWLAERQLPSGGKQYAPGSGIVLTWDTGWENSDPG
jgi:hypothetical protein